ncbi:ornithine cyclodeaminase family protein [Limibacillus halophilus]|uniref:Ornithine cyclodeaminase/alanine dehydrogenase n=1 Tax=Limibacillus halophilus TaxID=1579333 RepID=A0A839SNJ0_9PROT|nr:ornithine cyclodeaminase family protein [Limibacillus halophilus]MBB3063738.1 ornithine cyclodeaminase/alanine dehydrogenase [Limibacillus halophilus]
MTRLLFLNEAEVAALAPPAPKLADALADAFKLRAAGKIAMPTKTKLTTVGNDTFFHAMPALVPGMAAGVKWVGGAAGNSARGLPHINALLVLSDPQSGRPLAVMEANHLTGLRTAGLTLLAARYLAKTDASRLAVIGCGLQAWTHLEALASEFSLEQVAIYGRRLEAVNVFAEKASERGIAPRLCKEADEAITDADIVVSSIPEQPGLKPFLRADRLAPGAFAAMVDLGRSWRSDCLRGFDQTFTDDNQQSLTLRASNPTFEAADFTGDLGDLATGRVAGRVDADARIAFLFPGVALADIVIGRMLLEAAELR